MTSFYKTPLSLPLIAVIIFANSCSFYSNLDNMVSPNSKEENKQIWYDEIRSIEPTSDIFYINGLYENQYIQTLPEFIDTFANDKNFLFALYASGGIMEEWLLLARKIDSLYNISFIYCYHGTVRYKGYTQLNDRLFGILMDSTNRIVVAKNNYFNSPLYLDSLLYYECAHDSIFQNINREENIFYPLKLPNKGYETLGIISDHFCFGRQIFGVFINNVSNSFTYLNRNFSDEKIELSMQYKIASSASEKLLEKLFDFEWTMTYED